MEDVIAFGIKGNKTIQSWDEKFDCVYKKRDNALFISKEVFEGNTGISDFKYRYAIDCHSMDIEGCCTWIYILRMVVEPKYICEKVLSDMADVCGIGVETLEPLDVISCDLAVNFGTETSYGENIDYDVVTDIANVFELMDRMCGLYLDKNWNRYLNGWDVLRHCIEGVDMYEKTVF